VEGALQLEVLAVALVISLKARVRQAEFRILSYIPVYAVLFGKKEK
jgi:hypothetical protein